MSNLPDQGLVDAIVAGIDWNPTIIVEPRPGETPGQARERTEREAIVRMILGVAATIALADSASEDDADLPACDFCGWDKGPAGWVETITRKPWQISPGGHREVTLCELCSNSYAGTRYLDTGNLDDDHARDMLRALNTVRAAALEATAPRPPREVALAQAMEETGGRPLGERDRRALLNRADAIHAWLTQDTYEVRELRTCRVCACTNLDCSGCVAATGKPCSWVAPDLCSRCAVAAADQLEHAQCLWCEVEVARHGPNGAWWHVTAHSDQVGVHVPEPNRSGS